MKTMKKTLIASMVATIACVALLVGTTFAWFTDSVNNSGNIIKSGSLDVTMEWANGTESLETDSWKDASQGAIFNNELWEPGYSEVRHIKISNIGTLSLKYQINIIPNGWVDGVVKWEDDEDGLADVIDVYYIKGGMQIEKYSDLPADARVGTLAELLVSQPIATGHLTVEEGGDVDVATIALVMNPNAGNQYQNQKIGEEFAIRLVATQYTQETDGFGDENYDSDASYMVEINDATELKSALERPVNGVTYKIMNDIELSSANKISVVPGSKVSFSIDLNGHTVTLQITNNKKAIAYAFTDPNTDVDLTILDSSEEKAGIFQKTGGPSKEENVVIAMDTGDKLTLQSGTLRNADSSGSIVNINNSQYIPESEIVKGEIIQG